MRVLLVDDDRELARLLREYLGTHGIFLDPVEEGARGRAAVRGRWGLIHGAEIGFELPISHGDR
ncbi:MAG: response regulator [Polyangiaceae bacterium]|jgi:DNA-binding response OmpR family regulator